MSLLDDPNYGGAMRAAAMWQASGGQTSAGAISAVNNYINQMQAEQTAQDQRINNFYSPGRDQGLNYDAQRMAAIVNDPKLAAMYGVSPKGLAPHPNNTGPMTGAGPNGQPQAIPDNAISVGNKTLVSQLPRREGFDQMIVQDPNTKKYFAINQKPGLGIPQYAKDNVTGEMIDLSGMNLQHIGDLPKVNTSAPSAPTASSMPSSGLQQYLPQSPQQQVLNSPQPSAPVQQQSPQSVLKTPVTGSSPVASQAGAQSKVDDFQNFINTSQTAPGQLQQTAPGQPIDYKPPVYPQYNASPQQINNDLLRQDQLLKMKYSPNNVIHNTTESMPYPNEIGSTQRSYAQSAAANALVQKAAAEGKYAEMNALLGAQSGQTQVQQSQAAANAATAQSRGIQKNALSEADAKLLGLQNTVANTNIKETSVNQMLTSQESQNRLALAAKYPFLAQDTPEFKQYLKNENAKTAMAQNKTLSQMKSEYETLQQTLSSPAQKIKIPAKKGGQ